VSPAAGFRPRRRARRPSARWPETYSCCRARVGVYRPDPHGGVIERGLRRPRSRACAPPTSSPRRQARRARRRLRSPCGGQSEFTATPCSANSAASARVKRLIVYLAMLYGGCGLNHFASWASGHEFRREVQHLERFEPYRFFPLSRSRIRISGIRQSGDVEGKILPFPGSPSTCWRCTSRRNRLVARSSGCAGSPPSSDMVGRPASRRRRRGR
jgi:hypothetical protein